MLEERETTTANDLSGRFPPTPLRRKSRISRSRRTMWSPRTRTLGRLASPADFCLPWFGARVPHCAHGSIVGPRETYGQITIRALPTNTQTMGPRQAQDTMMSADEVAQDRTLLEGTNVVTNGNLLTLTVGDGEILYVEPVLPPQRQARKLRSRSCCAFWSPTADKSVMVPPWPRRCVKWALTRRM